jgi:uncharacterized membrane protein YhaH (DUF805 family)
MEWMILPLKRYAQFSGRSPCKEYWMFVLFNIIVSIVLSLVDTVLGLGGHTSSYSTAGGGNFAAGAGTSGGILSSIWSLAVLVPSIAVGVRRLHDIDRTGWWMLAPFVVMIVAVVSALARLGGNPGASMLGFGIAFVIGIGIAGLLSLVLLVWACMHGTRGPNRFGPDPYATMGDLHETFR